MVCGSHAKTRAMYSTPPCPSLATSTAAYRRRSFSDSQPKNRFIFCSTSAEYPSMPHSLIRGLLCSKDTAAQAIREVILDHILSATLPGLLLALFWEYTGRFSRRSDCGETARVRCQTHGRCPGIASGRSILGSYDPTLAELSRKSGRGPPRLAPRPRAF